MENDLRTIAAKLSYSYEVKIKTERANLVTKQGRRNVFCIGVGGGGGGVEVLTSKRRGCEIGAAEVPPAPPPSLLSETNISA